MPWNNQGGNGGGPWGGGGSDGPWGRGPRGGGGGPQPPDFEDFLRKSQEKMKNALPGGLGGLPGIALLVLLLVGGWMLTGLYIVEPDRVGIVLRFGEYVRTDSAGWNYHLPAPIETVELPQVTITRQIEVGFRSSASPRANAILRDVPEESQMITGDENIVDIDYVVFWRINNAKDYLFNVRQPEPTIKVAAESVMREVIGQTPIQTALTEGRGEIQALVKERLQKLLTEEYHVGVIIDKVQMKAVDPPASVVDAFNDVQRAKQDMARLKNEADAYANDVIPRARGDAAKIRQQALAYEAEVVNRAEGDAQRFVDVYKAYAESENITKRRLFIETMEDVLTGVNKVVLDKEGTGVIPYLPLPEIAAQSGSAAGSSRRATR